MGGSTATFHCKGGNSNPEKRGEPPQKLLQKVKAMKIAEKPRFFSSGSAHGSEGPGAKSLGSDPIQPQ